MKHKLHKSMRINGSLLPFARLVSPYFSKAGKEKTKSKGLDTLTLDLSSVFNSFLGLRSNAPLTVQTLEKIQEKFWPLPDSEKKLLCDLVWKCCEETALELLSERQNRQELVRTSFSSVLKSPVIFSTREGLGIDLELVQSGGKLTPSSFSISPAGCHVNVARALNNFGTRAELVGISSTSTIGNIFLKLLETEGVNTSKLLNIQGDTRYFFCIFLNGREYWIVSVPPPVSKSDIDKLNSELEKACRKNNNEVLALANNPPLGAPDGYMASIIHDAKDKYGMFVFYDTKLLAVGRELLNEVLTAGPSLIKPNLEEFAEIVDRDPNVLRQDKDLLIHLAQEVLEKYDMRLVLISCDKDGALLVDKKRAAYAKAPEVKVACTVGAGDTGIAAIIDRSKKEKFSLERLTDRRFKDILSAFVAGGTATVTKHGSELGTLEEVQGLEKRIKVKFV